MGVARLASSRPLLRTLDSAPLPSPLPLPRLLRRQVVDDGLGADDVVRGAGVDSNAVLLPLRREFDGESTGNHDDDGTFVERPAEIRLLGCCCG